MARTEGGAPSAPRESRLVNRNVVAGRGRTSMRLEPELWEALSEICDREDIDVGELIRRIEHSAPTGSRTSAVRVHIMRYFREAATETGHRAAGHGGQALAGGAVGPAVAPTTGNPTTGNPTTGNPTTGNPTAASPAIGNGGM